MPMAFLADPLLFRYLIVYDCIYQQSVVFQVQVRYIIIHTKAQPKSLYFHNVLVISALFSMQTFVEKSTESLRETNK